MITFANCKHTLQTFINMKKNIIALLALVTLFSVLPFNLSAQDNEARELLDRVATKLKGAGGIQAQFTATNYNGTEEAGRFSGTIDVKGRKYKLTSSELRQWYDGNTLYTIYGNSNEINVANPSRVELQQVNPYYFIDLYKQGYVLSVTDETHQGKPIKDVHLVSKSTKNPIQEMIISIGSDQMPFCVRMREGKKKWYKISVTSLKTGVRFADSDFSFDAKRFPGYDIIDLR